MGLVALLVTGRTNYWPPSRRNDVASDMIIFDGQAIGKQGPTARRKIGLLSAPEERLGHAAHLQCRCGKTLSSQRQSENRY